MFDYSADFDTTMRGLERGLRVEEIATFDLVVCNAEDSVDDLKRKFIPQGIDYLPVTNGNGGQVIGVFDVTDETECKTVEDQMAWLAEGMIVSSSDPIQEVLRSLSDMHYQLVVRRGRISGIVTKSDLLKLPVRILAFSQVSHLEMLLGQLITLHYPDNERWRELLSKNRLDNTLAKQAKLKEFRLDPPLLEFTDFCDKRDLVRKIRELPKSFENDLKKIEKLRNQVAHAANYSSDTDSARDFIARLLLTEEWISKIREMLAGK